MAASLPIVTTRVGAHAEVVEDGSNRYLIDVDETLRTRIEALARDPDQAARMGRRFARLPKNASTA